MKEEDEGRGGKGLFPFLDLLIGRSCDGIACLLVLFVCLLVLFACLFACWIQKKGLYGHTPRTVGNVKGYSIITFISCLLSSFLCSFTKDCV